MPFGWGFGWGPNPYPFCRWFPFLPRGWRWFYPFWNPYMFTYLRYYYPYYYYPTSYYWPYWSLYRYWIPPWPIYW